MRDPEASPFFTNPSFDQQSQKFNLVEGKKLIDNLSNEIYVEGLQYLTGSGEGERQLKKEILEKYNVGLGTEKFMAENGLYQGFDSVFFPIYYPKKMSKESTPKAKSPEEEALETDMAELVRMKVRACYKENKAKQRFLPYDSRYRGLFGLNVVSEQDDVIVITEGEFDAMAVNQQTGLPAVSLPNGKNSLP
jgi:twinkle protein